MTFETLETIYYLLKQEAENLERAYKAAHDEYKEAVADDRPEGVVAALKSDADAVYKEFDRARTALDEFKKKKW